jgi:hypothetical protein
VSGRKEGSATTSCGNSYSGTFSITAYDPAGNVLGPAVIGKVTATRISVEDTNPGSLF